MHPQMTPYHVVIQRAGTSKGIFIKRNELPTDLELRNRVIRAIFGSPDRRQIDGLGGADVLTSKLAIIGPPTRPDADVDYTFAQVSFDSPLIDYGGNCGNISAGVGPFAIDEGLIEAIEPRTRVRIHQTNTNCILIADVEVKDGKACVEGDCHIDGVPGTGSRIMLNFFDTVGSTTGKLLPTGNPTDLLQVEGNREYEVSIVDAGNVVVFIRAESLGLLGNESVQEIEANKSLMKEIEAIRLAAIVKIGMANTLEEAATKHVYAPFFSIISKPQNYLSSIDGRQVTMDEIDVTARLYFMLHMHKAYPGTGTVATGAAARIPGTLVYTLLSQESMRNPVLRIGHPGGVITVKAVAQQEQGKVHFTELSYERTSRRILEGTVYVRNSQINY